MSPQQTPLDSLLDVAARTPDHVVYRSFVNETVILNLDSGRYFGLNPTAGQMLEELVDSGTVREAAERFSARYEAPYAQVEEDLLVFCSDLEKRGLIELRSSGDT